MAAGENCHKAAAVYKYVVHTYMQMVKYKICIGVLESHDKLQKKKKKLKS